LTAPVLGADGRYEARSIYYNIPGLTMNPVDANGWAPGKPTGYHGGRYNGQHAVLIVEGCKDLWRLYSAVRNTPLDRRLHMISSTHGSGIPAQWADPEYWRHYDVIYLGHDRDAAGDAMAERIARTIGRRTRRVRVPERLLALPRSEGAKPPKDWTDYWQAEGASLDEFAALLDASPALTPAGTAAVFMGYGPAEDGAAATAVAGAAADHSAAPVAQPHRPSALPAWLLEQAPGVVAPMLRWATDTAVRASPDLMLQACWAVCSTAAGRAYSTYRGRTWPSLWFANLGRSGSGKDHGHSVVKELLSAGGAMRRIGVGGFTSAGGVFTALLAKPAQITLIDELDEAVRGAGKYAQAGQSGGMTKLLTLFGQCHSYTLVEGYSGMRAGYSGEQRQALIERHIQRPALTLLGLATPIGFYDALTPRLVQGGFLNRWLICEADGPRCTMPLGPEEAEEPELLPVPGAVSAWIAGVMPEHETPADERPPTIPLRIDTAAARAMQAFDTDLNRRMEALDEAGHAVLLSRTAEKAMRLSLLVALADDPGNRRITAAHYDYAKSYVQTLDDALLAAVRWRVGESEFHRRKHECLQHLARAGSRGLTEREMGRAGPFARLRPKEQQEVLEALGVTGQIEQREIATGGRRRHAWVAVQPQEGGD
jgi:hypothetical protein